MPRPYTPTASAVNRLLSTASRRKPGPTQQPEERRISGSRLSPGRGWGWLKRNLSTRIGRVFFGKEEIMRLCKILAVLALALLFTLPGHAAEPYKLRIGWVVAGADFTTLMVAKPELA